MSGKLVLVERIDGGMLVRLNRPEKRNAVNDAMADEAVAALDAAAADDSVQVIVLTGSGQSFCAGQDMGQATGRVERTQPGMLNGVGRLNQRLGELEKPVIAAINGFCFGGGTVTALQCDIRLSSDQATFRFPGAAYGLIVAASLLPAVIGQSRAKDLIFTGRVIDAAEAFGMGLVNRLAPPAELEALAREYVRLIAANSPTAVRYSKRVINTASLSQQATELELQMNRELRGGAEHSERFNAATDRIVGPRAG